MLIRILYVSTAVGPQTTTVTGTILRSAQAFNGDNGITGVLCQGQGVWLQVLEGTYSGVNTLYERILADKRHKNVQTIAVEDITQRRYGAWAMAHVKLTDADPMLEVNSPGAPFDPYAATASHAMARIDSLMASGKVMGKPVM